MKIHCRCVGCKAEPASGPASLYVKDVHYIRADKVYAEVERLNRVIQAGNKAPPGETPACAQLRAAHEAVWAMAEDGWLFCGVEGFTGAQQTVNDYTLKYPKVNELKASEPRTLGEQLEDFFEDTK